MEKRYMMLEKSLCRELELLEEKYRNGQEMSEGDLRRTDLLAHAIKSLATYTAMKQAEGYGYDNNSFNSYNGNSYMNSYPNNSYANNSYGNNSYDNTRGMRSREMGPDMSGHYPMNYPMYPEDRRW